MGWMQIDTEILNDRVAQTMSLDQFKAAVLEAARAGTGPLAAFIQPHHGRPSWSEWAVIRTRVFKRDDFTCAYCGKRGGNLECDHIVPVSRGGTNHDENLTTACFKCNRSKRNKLMKEWRR